MPAAALVAKAPRAQTPRTIAWTPGPLPVTRVKATAALAASKPVTHAFGWARGAIPSSRTLALDGGTGIVTPQLDQVRRHPDGSLRSAMVSFLTSGAIGSGGIASYQMISQVGSSPAASSDPTAIIKSATNLKLVASGGNLGGTYTLDVNALLTAGPRADANGAWGANPTQGWSVERSGPFCDEVRVWRVLRRDSDGALHGRVKLVAWVRVWKNGGTALAAEIAGELRHDTTYGVFPGATVGTDKGNYTCQIELFNDGTRLYAWGGPNDSRAAILDASAFDMAGNLFNWGYNGVPFTVSGPGVPSGVPQNAPLWIQRWDHRIATRRNDADNNGAFIAFGTAGSGRVTVTPLIGVTNATKQFLVDLGTRDPVWLPLSDAAGRPAIMVGLDMDYLARQARLFLPYDMGVLPFIQPTPGAPAAHQPNQQSIENESTGANTDDDRVGPISQTAVHALLSPFDAVQVAYAKSLALNFPDHAMVFTDERTGHPALVSYRTYPGLVGNPTLNTHGSSPQGSPPWQNLDFREEPYTTYGPMVDGSHLQFTPLVPWLLTGHGMYRDLGLDIVTGLLASQSIYAFGREAPFLGAGHENIVVVSGVQQVRGIGWAWRCVLFLDAMLADGHIFRSFIETTISDNEALIPAFLAAIDPRARQLGDVFFQYGNDNIGYVKPWMYCFALYGITLAAWRAQVNGSSNNWATLVDAIAPLMLDWWDPTKGGDPGFADVYQWWAVPDPDRYQHPINRTYFGPADVRNGNFPIAPVSTSGLYFPDQNRYFLGELTAVYAGNGGSYRGSGGTYAVNARAAVAWMALLGTPGALTVFQAIEARLRDTSLNLHGPTFAGVDNGGNPFCFAQYNVAVPS